MEQETTFEYNSLSCFLQLENLDTDSKQTTPKDSIFRDVSVLKLYYDILRNVEKDPFKYWNIYALRNYLWYFYELSQSMYSSIRHIIPNPLNIFVSSGFAIFFTGLYSKLKNKGSKEGIFIVCKKQEDETINRCVMSYSELLASDFKEGLDQITMKSTFEEYLPLAIEGAPATIEKIEGFSNDEYNNYEMYDNGNYKDTRLHILIDGVDNIPNDYFRILYGICPGNKYVDFNNKKRIVLESVQKGTNEFNNYQNAMIEAINKAIETAKNDNNFNQLPLNFYSNPKTIGNPFQYLLPIDFTGTGNPDFCACISVDAKGTGRLKTILNMNEVYGNVRVFGMDAVESVKDWWV